MKRNPFVTQRVRVLWTIGILCAALGLGVVSSWADLTGPTVEDQRITQVVGLLMRKEHLTQHDLDDEISQRCLSTFLQMIDPQKLYFYQADIDAFKARKWDLDDELRRGNISFAYEVFKVYQERLGQRLAQIEKLLAMEHDFTVDEEMIVDRDVAQHPRNEDEAMDLWRKRIKFDLLVLKASDKLEGQAARDKLGRRYRSFAKRMEQTSRDELLEMYLTSMTTAYDPHSTYMSPSTLENFDINMRLELEGIGAKLQFDDGYTVVNEVIPGGAADKDGRLKAEDQIVGVGQGQDGEIVDVVDMKLNDVVHLIRGKQGTVVRLQVLPVGQTEKAIYEITRARIELKDSEARGEVIEETRDGHVYRIGVIDLPSFYMDMEGARRGLPDFKSTTRDVAKLLEGFREQKVDVVVLDLRRNGGGSLSESIQLTGLFIDEGPVVQVKDREDRKQPYNDLDRGAIWEGPLVVLTSKFSASASEIFAGAIQDYGRGLIVGDESTHGKGTVQSLLDLGRQLFPIPNAPSLGALKITMQQFYRPNGESTQNRGVKADVVLPSLTSKLDIGEADLDYAVAFDRIDAVPFRKVDMVDTPLVQRLQAQSDRRCSESPDFEKVRKNIERYQKQKDRKTITLCEEKYLAERAELNADEVEKEQIEDLNDSDRPVFKRDYYNDEALKITLDYLQLGKLAHNDLAGERTAPVAN